jgi:hemolysin III
MKQYTLKEEIINSVTHGIGACMGIAGLTILVMIASLHGDVWHITSVAIYGSTLIILYLASTLYHGFQKPKIKQALKVFDHSAIYLLIAGSYTPFLLISLRGSLGWSLFGIVWGLAVLGIGSKIFFMHRFKKLSVLGYVLMGWLCVFALKEMITQIPIEGIVLLVCGGLAYTVGVIFYALERLPYNHAIWHLFVMGGSICHYFAILFYVLPR